ncbi:MAG: alpha/beta hydrolase [Deltaproteobacteria bacterium]|nr:alpha/beta hydrolase [Deltaproteobacteria bacterium]MBW2362321.1 alpha/beta hydrolase [Deltaproteobacteria bacterium]
MPYLKAENRGAIEIYYEEQGSGEPVILIGGLTSTIEIWGLTAPVLAERYRVITPDNRGSGRTRLPDDDGVRSFERFADDIRALVDGLDLGRVHLVGASLGGLMVQAFATAHADALGTLSILCSTAGEEHGIPVDREALADLVAGSTQIAAQEQGGHAIDGFTRAIVHPETPTKRPEALEFYTETKQAYPLPPEEIERRQTGGSGDQWDALPHVQAPTLVMTGDADVLVPPENSRILAGRIPNAEFRVIEGGGHIFFLEQPAATNEALLDFFGRNPLRD